MIDSGTGVLFKFTASQEDPIICTRQLFRQEESHANKIRTSVLMGRDDMIALAYGKEAHDRYLDMEPEERSDVILFERFKMCLTQAETHGADLTVMAMDGTPKPAVQVHLPA